MEKLNYLKSLAARTVGANGARLGYQQDMDWLSNRVDGMGKKIAAATGGGLIHGVGEVLFPLTNEIWEETVGTGHEPLADTPFRKALGNMPMRLSFVLSAVIMDTLVDVQTLFLLNDPVAAVEYKALVNLGSHAFVDAAKHMVNRGVLPSSPTALV